MKLEKNDWFVLVGVIIVLLQIVVVATKFTYHVYKLYR